MMNNTDDTETSDQIIAYAKAHGLQITRDQLERWHDRGPIARPQQVWLGRGHGSEARYPRGTAEILVAGLTRQPHPRDLARLAWELWFLGYDVPLVRARAYIADVAHWHDRIVAAMRAFGFARYILPRPARVLLRRIARGRLRVHGVPGIAARLASPDRIETVFRTLAQVATGGYERSYQLQVHDGGPTADGLAIAATDSDGLLVERAIGIERGRVDRLAGAGPWLTGDPTDDLVELELLLGGSWISTVRGATDEDLLAVREQARELEALLVSFGDFVDEHFGPEAFGFPAIAEALRSPSLLQRAGLAIILLRALRDPELRANIAQLRVMGERWRMEFAPKVAAMQTLRKEVPALRELLEPRRIGDAMRDEARLAAYQTELRAVAEANRERIEPIVARLAPTLSLS